MPILSQLIGHPADRVAVIDEAGEHSYGTLLEQSRYLARQLVPPDTEPDTEKVEYIAFMADRSASSIVALLAIWQAGGIAVPLDPLMPLPEWEWRIRDVAATRIVFAPEKKREASCLHSVAVSRLLKQPVLPGNTAPETAAARAKSTGAVH